MDLERALGMVRVAFEEQLRRTRAEFAEETRAKDVLIQELLAENKRLSEQLLEKESAGKSRIAGQLAKSPLKPVPLSSSPLSSAVKQSGTAQIIAEIDKSLSTPTKRTPSLTRRPPTPSSPSLEEVKTNISEVEAIPFELHQATMSPETRVLSTTRSFFKQARSFLAPEQYCTLVQILKDLNRQRRTREDVLSFAESSLFADNPLLQRSLEALLDGRL